MHPPDPNGPAGAGSGRRPASVLVVVFATILLDFIGFSVLIPVLPLYAERLGASAVEVGMLLTVYALAQLLFLPAWGWVSDRVGRRPVILVSLFGTFLSFSLLIFAEGLVTVYVARALAGFFAASIGTAQAVVTDVTGPEERARGMGMIGAAFGAGMIVGPALGGGAAALFGVKGPFWVIAALAAANLVLAWARLPESRPRDLPAPGTDELLRALVPTPIRLATAVHERRIGLYLYLFFHVFTAFAVLEAMFTLFVGLRFGLTEVDAALLFAWIGLFIALTQGVLLRRLVTRFGERRLVEAGLAIMAVGLLGIELAPSAPWLYVVGPVVALGNGIALPSLTSLYSKACRAEQAGELLGQSQAMATTGRIVGPVMGGLLMERVALGTPFVVSAGLMLLALLLFAMARRVLGADDASET